MVRPALPTIARASTMVLIGHEGRLSNLLTELTCRRHRPFREAGAVCVVADSFVEMVRGRGHVEFAVPAVDHQEAGLRAKVDSKKTVAALLAGFVLAALVGVLVEGPPPAKRTFADDLAIVSFATSLAFFVAAVTSMTSSPCPRAFGWTASEAGCAAGSQTPLRGASATGSTSRPPAGPRGACSACVTARRL